MPKMKTNRAAAKRFARTRSGRWKRRKSMHSHLLTKKSAKRKRHLRRQALIAKADERAVRRLLPHG